MRGWEFVEFRFILNLIFKINISAMIRNILLAFLILLSVLVSFLVLLLLGLEVSFFVLL